MTEPILNVAGITRTLFGCSGAVEWVGEEEKM
jgi:hypothetical protein